MTPAAHERSVVTAADKVCHSSSRFGDLLFTKALVPAYLELGGAQDSGRLETLRRSVMPFPMDAVPPPPPAHVSSLQLFSTEEHTGSPKPPSPAWTGILIAAPEMIVLGSKPPVVIVRGTFRIQGANYPKDDRLRIVAVDMATKQEYTGLPGSGDASPIEPAPPEIPLDPQLLARLVFPGFFNADLVSTVKLPWRAATYRVRAELGPIPSNEIMIQVKIGEN